MQKKTYLEKANDLLVKQNIYMNKEQTRWGEEGIEHRTVEWSYRSIKLLKEVNKKFKKKREVLNIPEIYFGWKEYWQPKVILAYIKYFIYG